MIQVIPPNRTNYDPIWADEITRKFNKTLNIGLSVTITTAKLTSGGTEGSMTFTNGLLTAQTQAT